MRNFFPFPTVNTNCCFWHVRKSGTVSCYCSTEQHAHVSEPKREGVFPLSPSPSLPLPVSSLHLSQPQSQPACVDFPHTHLMHSSDGIRYDAWMCSVAEGECVRRNEDCVCVWEREWTASQVYVSMTQGVWASWRSFHEFFWMCFCGSAAEERDRTASYGTGSTRAYVFWSGNGLCTLEYWQKSII